MVHERQRPGILSNLSSRQKMIAVVLVLVLLVLLWQIIGLFSESTPAPTTIQPVQTAQQVTAASPEGAAPQQTPEGEQPANPPAAAPGPAAAPAQPQMPQALTEGTVNMDDQILDLQKKTQQKYVDDLNQLQMLRVQREIAETNQAIATARLATVAAEKNVSDILTKPSQPPLPPPAPIPAGTYEAALAPGAAPTEAPPSGEVPPPPATPANQYVVISVSMQFGRWSAVLGYQGKLYNVSIGDVLPSDGSVVAAINKNGVTLVKGGKKRKISLISSV